MRRFASIWEVTPETAHPRAKELLGKSIVWKYGDQDSPLGNDTGADTFAAYLDFRANLPAGGIQGFIEKRLSRMRVPDTDWDLLDEDRLLQSLHADRTSRLLIRDDFIIGLAFAQLLLEGTVDPGVKQRAITAIRRQATDTVLAFRGGGGEEGRRRQLTQFRLFLESV